MRRKAGQLTENEIAALLGAQALMRGGRSEFHMAQLTEHLEGEGQSRPLSSLYRGLDYLETAGYLESRLEDAVAAQAEQRGQRRLYRLTGLGERVRVETETVTSQRRRLTFAPAGGAS